MVENMSDTEIYSRFKAILQTVVKSISLDGVSPATRLQEDLDIDSIRLVDVVLTVEDDFGIRIEDEAIERIKTVSDAVDLIKTKLG